MQRLLVLLVLVGCATIELQNDISRLQSERMGATSRLNAARRECQQQDDNDCLAELEAQERIDYIDRQIVQKQKELDWRRQGAADAFERMGRGAPTASPERTCTSQVDGLGRVQTVCH